MRYWHGEPLYTWIAWAAGLFEGEGYVHAIKGNGTVAAGVSMTDRDIVERFGHVIGFGRLVPERLTSRNTKPLYTWRVYGIEGVEQLHWLIVPWLGERRKEQFAAVFAAYEARTKTRRNRHLLSRAELRRGTKNALCVPIGPDELVEID